jgi:hypothetical protein
VINIRDNTTLPEDRFIVSFKKQNDGCWIWLRSKTGRYGRLRVNGVNMMAHRFSWILHNGPIPDGISVLHKCDVGLCVNPDHLFLGTLPDNMADMVSKERQSKGSHRPYSKLTEDLVRNLRKIYQPGHPRNGAKPLAKQFGVNYYTMMNLLTGKTWKHVR